MKGLCARRRDRRAAPPLQPAPPPAPSPVPLPPSTTTRTHLSCLLSPEASLLHLESALVLADSWAARRAVFLLQEASRLAAGAMRATWGEGEACQRG